MIKNIRNKSAFLLVTIFFSVLFFSGATIKAQVRKTFLPRTSSQVTLPYTNVKNYNLQGDFLMLGNTNMTLSSYNENTDNSNNNMKYVDVDSDNSTVNSSSAE